MIRGGESQIHLSSSGVNPSTCTHINIGFQQVYAPEFKTILITHRMIESLVVMAFDLNW